MTDAREVIAEQYCVENMKVGGAVADTIIAALSAAGLVIVPRITPAADVCHWRDDAYEGAFLPGCDTPEVWFRVGGDSTPKEEGYNFCPSCGKPIAFKETP